MRLLGSQQAGWPQHKHVCKRLQKDRILSNTENEAANKDSQLQNDELNDTTRVAVVLPPSITTCAAR